MAEVRTESMAGGTIQQKAKATATAKATAKAFHEWVIQLEM